jgi:hypothetical protein
MTTVNLSYFAGAGAQFFDNNGVPLSGGLLYTYLAGTTTSTATYTTNSGSIANSNPIVLDANGRVSNEIWLTTSTTYKFVLQTASAVQIGSWDNIPGINDYSALYTNFSSSTGSTLIGYTQGSSNATTETVSAKLKQIISVNDFGAVGDFNPSTGTGTDNQVAIQNALTYAATVNGGCTVYFPPGSYYCGTGYANSSLQVQLIIGSTSGANSATNVNLQGNGATLYQGAVGKLLGVFGCTNVSINNLTMFGYTGGAIGTSRQNDALITINYNSRNITVENCYLTNSLGDCIYVGGSLVSGGQNGYQSENILITNNTLKMRYGNGVASSSGGTYSRTCVAIIDCVTITISNNFIYGLIDFEPNLNGQYLVNTLTCNNQFLSGNVTAQSTIGTAYWYDEPINTSGGSVLQQQVLFNGVAASPVVRNNKIMNNSFEQGYIFSYNVYNVNQISNNFFNTGLIILGATSGTNYTPYVNVINNSCNSPNPSYSNTSFIQINGYIAFCNFTGNRAIGGFTNVINNNGASTGDYGKCYYMGNSTDSTSPAIGLTLSASSLSVGNASFGNASNLSISNMMQSDNFYSPIVSTPTLSGSYTIDLNVYRGQNIFITMATGTTATITNFTNSVGVGQTITIISGAAGGGGSLTIVNGTNIFLKGNTNAVMVSNQILTLIYFNSVWLEVSRSF